VRLIEHNASVETCGSRGFSATHCAELVACSFSALLNGALLNSANLRRTHGWRGGWCAFFAYEP
jgi:hypothetical protein